MSEPDIRQIAWEFRKGMIGLKSGRLFCYMISAPLHGYLRSMGMHTKLVEGEVCWYRTWIGHFWLELDDGRILDVTAEQFATKSRKMPKVYLGRKPKWYRHFSKRKPTLKESAGIKRAFFNGEYALLPAPPTPDL